jgi:hypothetical protein
VEFKRPDAYQPVGVVRREHGATALNTTEPTSL